MNNEGEAIVDWLKSKDEIHPDSIDEILTVPNYRLPSSDGYDIGVLNEEERTLIDAALLGVGDRLGIQLSESQRNLIESNIGRSRNSIIQNQIHVLAWYQPIHYFGHDWGIFISSEGLLDVARSIASYVKKTEPFIIEKLVYAAFCVLYSHEKFHHRIESFAIRLHVAERKSCYRQYSKNVYKAAVDTGSSAREEKLAMSSMFREILGGSKSKTLGKEV